LQLVPGGLANAPFSGHIWAICLQIFVFLRFSTYYARTNKKLPKNTMATHVKYENLQTNGPNMAQIWCVCEAAGHKLQRLLVGACGRACDMHAGRCYLSGLQSLPYAS